MATTKTDYGRTSQRLIEALAAVTEAMDRAAEPRLIPNTNPNLVGLGVRVDKDSGEILATAELVIVAWEVKYASEHEGEPEFPRMRPVYADAFAESSVDEVVLFDRAVNRAAMPLDGWRGEQPTREQTIQFLRDCAIANHKRWVAQRAKKVPA
jgi:hypothetical protein